VTMLVGFWPRSARNAMKTSGTTAG
jgi:hypothetical protein